MRIAAFGWALAAAVGLGGIAQAAHKWNLKEGTPDLKSAGQLAFGPDGVLFIGDAKGAAVFAVDTGDIKGEPGKAAYAIDGLNEKLATAVGASNVVVNDLAVNPASGNVYLSVSVGEDKTPAIVKVGTDGKLAKWDLKDVPFQRAAIANPPEDKVTGEGPRARNRRNEAITDMAYSSGKILLAGITADAASSKVREIPFPFADGDSSTTVEIYHAAHGKVEDNAAIRTFVPFTIDGQPSLLAGFTCTPLVRFPIEGLKAGEKVRGTTVAELGNRNTPIDMLVYEKNGEKFLLMTNTARGVMKISTKDIGRKEGLTEPVSGGGTKGQEFETIKELEGTVQLDRLNDANAVIVVKSGDALAMKTIVLP